MRLFAFEPVKLVRMQFDPEKGSTAYLRRLWRGKLAGRDVIFMPFEDFLRQAAGASKIWIDFALSESIF